MAQYGVKAQIIEHDETKTNTCTFCGTKSHMLWYDGYEVAYIYGIKDTAACEMHDSPYK